MKLNRLNFDGFWLSVPENWDVLSRDDDENEMPLTIADSDNGVGALQISPAIYRAGASPHIDSAALNALLNDFSVSKGFGKGFDAKEYATRCLTAGESYHWDDDFVRIWYASDGKSVLLISYVSEWANRNVESIERELIVESIRFPA